MSNAAKRIFVRSIVHLLPQLDDAEVEKCSHKKTRKSSIKSNQAESQQTKCWLFGENYSPVTRIIMYKKKLVFIELYLFFF